MKWKHFILFVGTIGLSLIAFSLWAGDFSRYSTEELMRMHNGIHRMNPGERQSLRKEMHSRYSSMTPDERRQYRGYMHDGTHRKWDDHHEGAYHHDQDGHRDDGFWNDMDHGGGGTGRSTGYSRGGGC